MTVESHRGSSSENDGPSTESAPASVAAAPDFWSRSLQNWQSEFLSVGLLVVLSIFLRQKGSPESKPGAAAPGPWLSTTSFA